MLYLYMVWYLDFIYNTYIKSLSSQNGLRLGILCFRITNEFTLSKPLYSSLKTKWLYVYIILVPVIDIK